MIRLSGRRAEEDADGLRAGLQRPPGLQDRAGDRGRAAGHPGVPGRYQAHQGSAESISSWTSAPTSTWRAGPGVPGSPRRPRSTSTPRATISPAGPSAPVVYSWRGCTRRPSSPPRAARLTCEICGVRRAGTASGPCGVSSSSSSASCWSSLVWTVWTPCSGGRAGLWSLRNARSGCACASPANPTPRAVAGPCTPSGTRCRASTGTATADRCCEPTSPRAHQARTTWAGGRWRSWLAVAAVVGEKDFEAAVRATAEMAWRALSRQIGLSGVTQDQLFAERMEGQTRAYNLRMNAPPADVPDPDDPIFMNPYYRAKKGLREL